jgi:hypothetical protein
MWVKAGFWNVFDVQAGRFRGWEIYHYGLGLDLNTQARTGAPNGPQIYGVSYLWDYPTTEEGSLAVHWYLPRYVRFELAARYGDGLNGTNEWGLRPVGIFDIGFLKVKAGYEYADATPQDPSVKNDTKRQGFGAAIQGIFYPYVEAGFNAAYGQQRQVVMGITQGGGSYDTYSLGAFANFRIIKDLMIGGGVNYTYYQNEAYNTTLRRDVNTDHWQTFGAIQYMLWKQLLIKNEFAYALSNQNPTDVTPFQTIGVSDRIRFQFFF